MARSTEEIYNSIITEKQTYDQLGGLMPQYDLQPPTQDNPFKKLLNEISAASVVSIWRLIVYLVANAQHILETLWDNTIAEMNAIATQSIAGTTSWYAAQVSAWQYGYSLYWNPGLGRYYYTDTTSVDAIKARIVAKVSVNESFGNNFDGIVIKAAKNSNGVLAPLTSTELANLTVYVNRIKFAGVLASVISIAPDKIKLSMDVYYDGTLDLTAFQTLVNAAIQNFITHIQFDGTLHINDLIDAIQAVPGAVSPSAVVNTCFCKTAADAAYPPTPINEKYDPASGYFEFDTANSILNYKPV